MSKLKGKLVKRHKDVKEVYISEIPDLPDAVEDQGVVRTKEIELTAMTRDEAILQMELLDHSFFAYADSETGTTNIVYKRERGGYGLLITR
jgi:putative sigma-54 modulation protein